MSEAVETTNVIRRPGFNLRPVPARWFELLTWREDLTRAVEALARTNRVELDTRSETAIPIMLPDLQQHLEEYNRLAQRFRNYWPEEGLSPSEIPGDPGVTLEKALRQLQRWRTAAEPIVREIESLRGERAELDLLREMLSGLIGSGLKLSLLPHSGLALSARAFVLPHDVSISQMPPGVIATRSTGSRHDFLLAVGPPAEMDGLEQELGMLKGRRIQLPSWLEADPGAAIMHVDSRHSEIDGQIDALYGQLEALEDQHRLRPALGDIDRIEWFLTHVGELPVTENFAWVTGWTSEQDIGLLEKNLQKAEVRSLLRFPEPPADKTPPMVLSNPVWAQPFELFARLLGTPAANEADPSRLLVFIVPLLFGYMFGDVGQGLVLFLVGLWLWKRYPALRLLVPGGLMSMLFGFLFGSVFSREDWLPALWLRPLEEPLLLLVIPLIGGVLLLVLGLGLSGIESRWRGAVRQWWLLDAPLLLLYLALVALFITPYAGLAASGAALWYFGGRVYLANGDLRVLGAAVGRLLEAMLQLLINTLSFTRVGAFALAHAGLSAAVVGLADATGHAIFYAIVMIVGNIIIMVLEGLVVSVQITRLVLFEFFIRFLRGEGRTFHPLTAPGGRKEKT
ncbi:V-type ATPase 116kDa subunit family protein [Thiohalomonas denitrificans]|uniref:V-type ATPase 116kDa subunit family protein n=1 Tax=Thiohalomonas denitrificans TaxID=415747 RepID=UPI0026EC8938|nr:V-type ATPase 116kDa subunit family protein [Thiohalomonas denitrificans]